MKHIYEQVKEKELRELIKKIWLEGVYYGINRSFPYGNEDKEFDNAINKVFKELNNDNKRTV